MSNALRAPANLDHLHPDCSSCDAAYGTPHVRGHLCEGDCEDCGAPWGSLHDAGCPERDEDRKDWQYDAGANAGQDGAA